MGAYYDGMFAHDGDNPDDVYYQAVYAHEAGHAVAGHVLAQPCKFVRVENSLASSDNVAMGLRRDNARVNAILRSRRGRNPIPQLILDDAIVICAGPAAELRWCAENGLPIRVHYGSTADHDNVMSSFAGSCGKNSTLPAIFLIGHGMARSRYSRTTGPP